jgi:hypothetical protein
MHTQTTPTLGSPAHWGTASWATYMGFEHERIHIETSSVLIREVRRGLLTAWELAAAVQQQRCTLVSAGTVSCSNHCRQGCSTD